MLTYQTYPFAQVRIQLGLKDIILCRYDNENPLEDFDWTLVFKCHILTPRGTRQDGSQPEMNLHIPKYLYTKFGAFIEK